LDLSWFESVHTHKAQISDPTVLSEASSKAFLFPPPPTPSPKRLLKKKRGASKTKLNMLQVTLSHSHYLYQVNILARKI